MHTSQSSRQKSCEDASHTVPSPHAGEGQGGGWRRCTARELIFSAWILKIGSLGAEFGRHRIGGNRCAGYTPLPVPPPHGGRERCGTALPISRNSFAYTVPALSLHADRRDLRCLEPHRI